MLAAATTTTTESPMAAHRRADNAGGMEADWRGRALIDDLRSSLPEGGRTADVIVGLHWTAVVCERENALQCGLASTLSGEHSHGKGQDVAHAGYLLDQSPPELVKLATAASPSERAIGLAAINASLPQAELDWEPMNAGQAIARYGAGKPVALVGHFPFIPQVQEAVGQLFVIEQEPLPGELPAASASEILPRCSVVALTAMTLLNRTFGTLMGFVDSEATVMLLGPSAPLSPLLFDHGLDLIAGTHVSRVQPVTQAIKEGANYRQIHRIGTRLMTLSKASVGAT